MGRKRGREFPAGPPSAASATKASAKRVRADEDDGAATAGTTTTAGATPAAADESVEQTAAEALPDEASAFIETAAAVEGALAGADEANPFAGMDADALINLEGLAALAAAAAAPTVAAAPSAFPRPERFKIPKRGQKDFEPRGTAAEALALAEARDQFRQVLVDERRCAVYARSARSLAAHVPRELTRAAPRTDERPARRSSRALSQAVWDPATATAIATVIRGGNFVTTGHHVNGRVHLLPEEAAFMVDRANLQLQVDGQPVSYQHALMLSMTAGVSLEAYLVYAHLKRLGFVVKRAGVGWHELPATVAQPPFPSSAETLEADSSNIVSGRASDSMDRNGGATSTATAAESQASPASKEAAALQPPASPAVVALFQPTQDQLTTAALYERLSIIKAGHPTAAAPRPDQAKIMFDVYRPNRKFSKRSPPPVAFKVVVQSILDVPPDAYTTTRLFAEAGGVPLKLAVVQGGSLTFYAWVDLRLTDVTVPLVPTIQFPSPTPAEQAARAAAKAAARAAATVAAAEAPPPAVPAEVM